MNKEEKICQNHRLGGTSCQKTFEILPEDFNFYAKIKVPPPTFCPDCRLQRKLIFRNNRVLYRRECELCKKSILSNHSSDKSLVVYCHDCWLGDKWDPITYGQDYDFSKPFFEQWRALRERVPRTNLYQTNFISSEYCNYGLDIKSCYLLFGGVNDERVYFANQIIDSRDSFDIDFSEKVEFSYELLECQRSNKLYFSRNSSDCADSYCLVDCRNCLNCFGCVGLVNKQYHIWNKPYSKEEYKSFLANANLGSFKAHLEFLENLYKLSLQVPFRYARIYKSTNSSGNDLLETNNTKYSFSSRNTEDSKYLFFVRGNKTDVYDTMFVASNGELIYEMTSGFGGSNTAFGIRNLFNQNARYSEDCKDCTNIFGCEGLQKKQYCILNKEYSKEEYEALVPKIIEHMDMMPFIDQKDRVYKYGEFFPAEFSPFAYNESIAQEYFPFSKEEALEKGFVWKEDEVRNYKIEIETKDIPDSIKNTDKDIIGKVIACGHSGKCKDQCTEAFKILPDEFQFYKNNNLPLPRLCPNCRHYERMRKRNPLKLWHRQCMCEKESHEHKSKCEIEFETSYAPERPEIIYCEKCYQQEVY